MVEGERDSVRIQSPLMQINADTVCLVRTQFQHFIRNVRRQRAEGCVVDLLTPQELKKTFPCCDRQRQNGSPLSRG